MRRGPSAPVAAALALWAASSAAAERSPQLTGGFADVEGGRIYYQVAGSGPAVVLLHGGNLDRRMWDDQMERLAARFRVVRYDIRPYGESTPLTEGASQAEDLRALLDHLEIDRACLVGLSLGGRIVLDFALEHPQRVDRMVLAGPGLTGFAWSDDAGLRAMAAAAEAGEPERAVELWLEHPYMAPAMEHPELSARIRGIAMENLHVWSQPGVAEQLPDPPTIARLDEIRVPTLLLLGERDVPDIHAIVARLAEGLPAARAVTLPGVGHLLNMEAPDTFDRLTLDFLQECGGG